MHFLNRSELIEFVRERAGLLDLAGARNPFSRSSWILHFLENVAEADWVFTVPESYADGHSFMLLYSDNPGFRHCTALTNYYASLYSPMISSAGSRYSAMDQLVGQLMQARSRCAVINLAPMDQEDSDSIILRAVFARRGWYTRKYFCFGNWYLPCAGLRFDEYMKQRPSQTYNTWARKSKKYFKYEGARIQIATSLSDVQLAIDAYQTIYAKSWKKPEPYPRFVEGWAKICAKNGWLRLGIAWIDNVPVAAQFWFTVDQHAYIFKLAYDEDYANWSAGTLLTAHMIKHSLEEDHVIEIDYLTGDDEYKSAWMTHRRERIGVLACNLKDVYGVAMAAREFAGAFRNRWLIPAFQAVRLAAGAGKSFFRLRRSKRE